MRGATFENLELREITDISIHAPREGRDGDDALGTVLYEQISIHAPREGRDALNCWNCCSI